MPSPTSLLLYSTVTLMKWRLCEFYVGQHYLWCSESFDGAAAGQAKPWATSAPSSNPKAIYENLSRAVRNNDKDDAKIKQQRASMKRLALNWHSENLIDEDSRDEIIYQAGKSLISEWKPRLVVIPAAIFTGTDRCQFVSASKRASSGFEWIVADLKSHECDILELVDA